MISFRRYSSANSAASSLSFTSTLVPRSLISAALTSKLFSPVAYQLTALARGLYDREVTRTQSATMKTE